MPTDKKDIQELIAQLRIHYERVQANATFFSLKQSEFRPDSEISFFGFHQAREQLFQEHSLLAGHAHLVQETITREKITISATDQRLLREIASFSRQQLTRS
jgi:hypothetical protein